MVVNAFKETENRVNTTTGYRKSIKKSMKPRIYHNTSIRFFVNLTENGTQVIRFKDRPTERQNLQS